MRSRARARSHVLMHPPSPFDRSLALASGTFARLFHRIIMPTLIEEAAHHLACDLLLADDDLVSPEFLQMLDLGGVVCTGDDTDARIGGPRAFNEVSRLERVWDGADQPARGSKIYGVKKSALRG